MAQITIEVPNGFTEMEKIAVTRHFEKMARNVTKDNLAFLAELSERPGINQKLESKKAIIKMAL